MSAAASVTVLLGLLIVTTPALAAPAVPTVVLFPRAVNSSDDSTALSDVRKSLRRDGALEVLTFDPAGGAFTRAAADAHRPEWLTASLSDDDRAALCRAVGAQFYAVVGRGDKGRADIRLSESAPSARVWTITEQKSGDAAHQVEQLSNDALAHPQPSIAAAPSRQPSSIGVTHSSAPGERVNTGENKPVVTVPITIHPAPVAASVLPNVVPPAPTVLPPGRAVSNPLASVPALAIAAIPSRVAPLPIPNPVSPVSHSAPAGIRQGTVPTAVAVPALPSPRRTDPQTLAATSLPNIVPPAPPISFPTQAGSNTERNTEAVLPPRNGTPSTEQRAYSGVTDERPAARSTPQDAVAVQSQSRRTELPRDITPSAEDVRTALDAMSRGDDALARSDPDGAISDYRAAVNATPLAPQPRLKLARAYLKADMKERALDEGRRALLLDPDNTDVQQLLSDIDAQTGSSDGAVARAAALLSQKPQDTAAHLTLGDALWNNGQTGQAEGEYKQALSLVPDRSAAAADARAHLARLYAAQSRYTECLAALRGSGRAGYALALSIVQSRADLLAATLEAARSSFDMGKSTHEAFYKTVTDAAAQTQALSNFVEKATPPPSFALSHAHRILATQLLAQQAAVLVTYAETGSGTQAERASQLEKAAETEMLTAHAAETKLGLWNGSVSANN